MFHNRLRSITRIADVDVEYIGNAGRVLQVNAAEDGIDLGAAGSSHAHSNLAELAKITIGDHDVTTGNPHGTTIEEVIGGEVLSDQLKQYKVNDIDVDSDPQYFGFTDKDGNWYISKKTESSGAFRYAKGTSNYTTNWSGRSLLSYDYFYNVF